MTVTAWPLTLYQRLPTDYRHRRNFYAGLLCSSCPCRRRGRKVDRSTV